VSEKADALRAFIGSERAEELRRVAHALSWRHRLTPDELLYMSHLFDGLADMSARAEVQRIEEEHRAEEGRA
jgi:hypothetical protein